MIELVWFAGWAMTFAGWRLLRSGYRLLQTAGDNSGIDDLLRHSDAICVPRHAAFGTTGARTGTHWHCTSCRRSISYCMSNERLIADRLSDNKATDASRPGHYKKNDLSPQLYFDSLYKITFIHNYILTHYKKRPFSTIIF